LRTVIESIHLKRFKNFQDATLKFFVCLVYFVVDPSRRPATRSFSPAWTR